MTQNCALRSLYTCRASILLVIWQVTPMVVDRGSGMANQKSYVDGKADKTQAARCRFLTRYLQIPADGVEVLGEQW